MTTDTESNINQARVPCPRCAELILRDALACRFCGHEIAPPSDKGGRGWKIALAILAALGLGFCALVKKGENIRAEMPALSPMVTVRHHNATLVVQNSGAAVAACRVEINDRFQRTDIALAAGGDTTLQMASFVDRDGLRFDPQRMKPMRVWVSCPRHTGALFTFR